MADAEQATRVGHEGGHHIGDRAPVEGLGAFRGDGAEGLGQIVLHQDLSWLGAGTIDQIGRGGGRVETQVIGATPEKHGVLHRQRESNLGVFNGRGEHVGRLHRAVAAQGFQPSTAGPRNQGR